MISLHSFQR